MIHMGHVDAVWASGKIANRQDSAESLGADCLGFAVLSVAQPSLKSLLRDDKQKDAQDCQMINRIQEEKNLLEERCLRFLCFLAVRFLPRWLRRPSFSPDTASLISSCSDSGNLMLSLYFWR